MAKIVKINFHELAMSMSSARKDMVGGKVINTIRSTPMTLPDLTFDKIICVKSSKSFF